jgi:hypothetical protein
MHPCGVTVAVFTSEKARVAAEIIDQLAKVIGHGKAGFWMLAACSALGVNCSPIMALKAGREQEVRAAAAALIDERKPIGARSVFNA